MKNVRPTFLWACLAGASLFLSAACSSDVEFTGGTAPAKAPKEGDAVAEVPTEATTPVDVQTPEVEAPPEKQTSSVEQVFYPVQVETLRGSFEPETQLVDQTVTMQEQPPQKQMIKQLERVKGSESFKQGRDAQKADPETFSITEAGKLDLLVVMDDSTSMDSEQTNLASKLDSLISKLENTDWQIAVVTTSDPCLRENRLIKKTDADRNSAFAAAIGNIVLSDTVIEKGFPMAIKALKGECKGAVKPWLRDNAAVGILIVSDEDNCGSNAGEGCPGEEGETVPQMVTFLNNLRPGGMGRIYGLFEGANECGASAYTATKYKQGVDQTGGKWGSICQNDYSTTLQSISDDVRKIVKREFVLKFPPDSGTLLLSVDGNAKTTGFTLSGSTLVVSDFLATDQTLVVNYAYGSVPKKKIFRLAGTPDPSTVKIKVNNAAANASDYSYDESQKDVIFTNEPIDDATIEVSYRVDTDLPTDFAIASNDLLGAPLAVTVDGSAVTNYSYDAVANKIKFDDAPVDGQSVEVTYKTKSGRKTRYTSPITSAPLAVVAKDHDTNAPVDVQMEGGELVFLADDVLDQRMIDVQYDIGYKPADMRFPLAFDPIGGSVEVKVSDPSCEKAVAQEGSDLVVECGSGKAGVVDVKYDAVTAVQTQFVLNVLVPDGADWDVYVDNVLIPDVKPVENRITLPAEMFGIGSKVLVKASWKD